MRFLFLILPAVCPLLANDEATIRAAARSPHSLVQFVVNHTRFDWHTLWKTLGVGAEVVLPPCWEPGKCTAEIIEVVNPRQAIVKLMVKPDYLTVYLRYRSTRGWQFGGYHFSELRYDPPRHKIVRAGEDGVFLVVNDQGWRGTGIASELEIWRDLASSNFDRVFGYTVRGHRSNPLGGINREVMGKISVFRPREIQVDRRVKFSTSVGGRTLSLGSRHDHMVYRRSRGGRFVLDPTRSSISENSVWAVYEDLDTALSNERFLEYNAEALEHIASAPEGAEKRWLRTFLTQCKPTPEQRRLKALVR